MMKEEKRFEITNSLMFAAVMSNKEICKQFIERVIPDKKIKSLEINSEIKSYVETEKTIVVNPLLKQIRLDVLFIGEDEWINIEMQMSSDGNQPLRARYYDATMTVNQIKPGDRYDKLKTNYVIFINMHDIFKKGKAIYTFTTMEIELGTNLLFDDKTYKIVVCIDNFEKAESSELKSLLNYMHNGEVNQDDSFICELDHIVDQMNGPDSMWRESIMTIEEMMNIKYDEGKEEGILEGVEKGIQEGEAQEKKKNALKMKKFNIDNDVISEVTGLSKEEIEEL